MRNVLVVVGVVFLVIIVAIPVIVLGYVALENGMFTPGHRIEGVVELNDAGTSTFHGIEIEIVGGVTCHGTGGYSDIAPGVPVTVKDENGKLLGPRRSVHSSMAYCLREHWRVHWRLRRDRVRPSVGGDRALV